jgi:recombination protein RecT
MTTNNPLAVIAEDIYALREHFGNVSAYPGINFEKEAAFAMQALAGSDYAIGIAIKNPQSVRDAVTNVAAIGISLNPALKQAYLVPRKDRICLDISYMGLIHLAIDTGSILWAQAGVVREHDTFTINGYDKPPSHGHDPFAAPADRGPIKGAYVVVKTPDGEYLTHTMAIAEIHATRDRSESWKAYIKDNSKKNPWVTDESEMVKKTVVKQAQKYWPKTDRTGRVDEAVHMLNTDGEGFDKSAPGAGGFSEQELVDWIAKVHATKTDADAAAVWKDGATAITKLKDLQAYEAFKTAVVAHRTALRNAPIDVEAKVKGADPAATTFSSVMDMLIKAKNADALMVAGDWIRDVPDEGQRSELQAKFEALSDKFQK